MPSGIELNLISQSFAARNVRLDPKHPLRTRTRRILTKASKQRRTADSRLSGLILALPKTEHINPIALAHWRIKESRLATELRINGHLGRSKEQAAKDFERFIPTIPGSDLQVFSDGSKSEALDGATSGASFTFRYNIQLDRQIFSLGRNADVFDARRQRIRRPKRLLPTPFAHLPL